MTKRCSHHSRLALVQTGGEVELIERGIDLAHTTILRLVQYYSPEFEKRWNRYARSVGGSWRCDETYVKVKGAWVYLYRAVDKAGKTVEFDLSGPAM